MFSAKIEQHTIFFSNDEMAGFNWQANHLKREQRCTRSQPIDNVDKRVGNARVIKVGTDSWPFGSVEKDGSQVQLQNSKMLANS